MTDRDLIAGRPQISVEYFPTNGVVKERALMTTAYAMRRFSLDFQTVTFGAGGTAVDGSYEWSTRLAGLTDVPTASHVTLSHFSDLHAFHAFLDDLREAGIRHLVLLRGDPAEGRDGLCGFSSVADAVRVMKRRGWEVSVAAYPETHPLAKSAQADIDVLRAKQDSGADRAITQFFFDNDDFYRWRDRVEQAGITLPIVAGVMPVVNFERIASFAVGCGARVPGEMRAAFDACADNAAHTQVARDRVERQVRDLAANGVDAIHVYSMNRIDLAADTIRAFQDCFTGEAEDADQRLVG